MTRIAYLVHDVNDAAVARRVRMLKAAGGDPVVMGFRRDDRSPAMVEGAQVVDLGQTRDAKLVQRALAVLANLARPGPMLRAAAGADVVIGRNLEALILAARVQKALPEARLVYECLDIHRTLLGRSPAHRAIQAVERALLRKVRLLIVSSPAFVSEYFARRASLSAPVLLMENKLLALDSAPPAGRAAPAGPPWTIGWFGNLRCSRTLEILTGLAARHAGRVEILIAGRPSPAVFDDFEGRVAAAPHCTYVGPYGAADLPELYARCHFAWAIDYFEEGLNSSWLLPNRLYEAASFGVVPIASDAVETGRWLARHNAGLLIDGDDPARLDTLLAALDDAGYGALRSAVDAIPRTDLIADATDCAALMQAVTGR